MSAVLALQASGRAEAALVEFLRILVGLVAAGGAVTLVEVGRGRGLLSQAGPLPDDAARYVEVLAEDGVRPQPLDAVALLACLRSHAAVVRLGDRERRGQPEVLRIDDGWLAWAAGREEAAVQEVVHAGQVLRRA